ncbi:hypothetical protein PPERSA_03738 [Pseudocohnilembus persalinus]|uniref:KIF-binding protein n=1 Tax=Pseudocohnilembus persalinus TaxID=266149 RepID=A0A0V0QHK5_PSEPJ|nr:hypothetical protein PPERSA_03738 [Pseudocohnilembus persalinus]|eukprot:KRX01654.1 hypothetical protein PPERSA_03738 [Pseudocohnilembus persalinus]
MKSDEIEIFLKSEFQQTLEKGENLANKIAPEEEPYVFKYQQREILEQLMKNHFLSEIKYTAEKEQKNENQEEDSEDQMTEDDEQNLIAAKMILNIQLGQNYQECEEGGQAIKFFNQALQLIRKIKAENMYRYYNFLQELYNIFGILYINRDENQQGMGFLGKAVDLYNAIIESSIPQEDIINNSQKINDTQNQNFYFYYEGGLSKERTESLYTHTLFYLAQGYTKFDQKELAAKYCGLTMKRQFKNKTYELKDFCVNCISLSDFYAGMHNFQQGEYLILAALSLIPEGKKRKLRATLEMSLGFLLFEYLKISVKILAEDRLEEEGKHLKEVFNTRSLEFEGIQIPMKEIEVKKDFDEVKSIFRQANTQFKKALNYFVLDGFVTEHIQILEQQGEMYKQLAILESDFKKKQGLYERRLELLEPVFSQINSKSFQQTWEKLLVEVAETYNFLFEQIFMYLFVEEKEKPKPKHFTKLNQYGEKVIELYGKINEILVEDKDTERNAAYYNTVITAKFNQAKAYSRVFKQEKQDKVQYLIQSMKSYQWIMKYIDTQVPKNLRESSLEFDQQYDMCQEMVNMLPAKIDKVNAGII